MLPSDGAGPFCPAPARPRQQTQWLIDQEVQRLVEEAHAEVTELLTSHRGQLDSLAHALLVAETLDGAAAYAAAGVKMPPPEPEPEPEPEPTPRPAVHGTNGGTAGKAGTDAEPGASVGQQPM